MKAKKTNRKLITGLNFRDFDWNKAKYFYHIVKCGGFVKASETIGIDQPSLTRQMQSLEIQVGCPLLVRQTWGVELTRKGEELFEKISPFFLEMKGFCGNTYVEVGEEKKRKIRIATSHAVAAYVINDLLIQYNKEHPNISFEVIVNDHSIDIILDDVDIAIRPHHPTMEGIQQDPLFTLEKKLYASNEYLAKHGEPTKIKDLNHHQLLTYPISTEYPYSNIGWILKVEMPEGELRKPFYTANSVECLVDAAKSHMGIVSGYEQMKIFRDSGLKIILHNTKSETIKGYFVYPDYLKEDTEIIEIKNYLKTKLNSKTQN